MFCVFAPGSCFVFVIIMFWLFGLDCNVCGRSCFVFVVSCMVSWLCKVLLLLSMLL